jgi:D-alanyl-D-alanine carboxypeptidase/D-alanyl-D-alanine-endopeptidase (penicillin-binding protein 4)
VQATPLPAAFTAALREAGIPLETVAVVIQPVEALQPILTNQSLRAMNPASVMKLVTSLSALEQLGPAYTWKTDIWAEGEINHRVLTGDLIIKGYGDPTLTLERMWLLQRELRARGIDEIHGKLILDTHYFELPALDPGLLDADPLAIYNAIPSALLANYNATTLKLNVVDNAAVVTSELHFPELILTSHLALEETECGEWKDRLRAIRQATASQEVVFEGRYARSCGEKQLSFNLLDAVRTFDYTFRAMWLESGGKLTGSTQLGTAPISTPPLISFPSIPLAEALRNLNKYSNNLMTRNLFLTLGATHSGAPLEKSRHAIEAWLAEKQIAAPELVLENGAGLSRIERISATTLSRVLLAAYRSPYFSEFESALPIVGVDGTLRRRFTDSVFAGRAHLKTGTLKDARALAGYVLTRAGKRVVFVMLVNHAHADRAELAQRALLEWTYAYSPKSAEARHSKK